MSRSEIVHDATSGISAYERGHMSRFDLAVLIENCGEELRQVDSTTGTRLKGLAVRLAAMELIPNETEEGALNEIKVLLSSLDGDSTT